MAQRYLLQKNKTVEEQDTDIPQAKLQLSRDMMRQESFTCGMPAAYVDGQGIKPSAQEGGKDLATQ